MLAAAGVAAWGWYCITQPYQGFASGGVFLTVPHGASSRGVAHILESNGVVRSALAFEIYARRHPRRSLEAGEYLFDHPVSGREVFWKLAKGEVYEIPFTVREGETLYDIAHDLEAGHFLPADDFVKAASDPMMVRDIDPHALTLEGYLFPATYQLPRHPVAVELTAAMVKKVQGTVGTDFAADGGRRQNASRVRLSDFLHRDACVARRTRDAQKRRTASRGGSFRKSPAQRHDAAM